MITEPVTTKDQARHAYCDGLSGTSRSRSESAAEFDRMIAEVERAAAERALAPVATLLNEITAKHSGRIATHWLGCYQYHAGCLAFRLLEMITDETGKEARDDRD